MTAPKPNAELAYRVLDHIDANPEAWDQAYWFSRESDQCGTAACFAGWASLLSGDEPRWSYEGQRRTDAVTAGRKKRYIAARAAELLGITEEASDGLFDGGNSRDDLGHLVAEIFGPRPEPAPDRWSAMVPNPHPSANCGPLLLALPPGVMCPTCGTVPPVLVDDVPPNAGSAS